ncbi:MAG: hypothetical protein R3E66_07545 [bacterium]
MWRGLQVKGLRALDPLYVEPSNAIRGNWDDPSCADDDRFWREPALGLSISAPEIATLAIEVSANNTQQRPVAVFAAGDSDENLTGCGEGLQGSAIYVVDLQTGALIRRFVSYFDETGANEQTFAKSTDAAFQARFGRIKLRKLSVV